MILNQIAGQNFMVGETLAHELDMALVRQKNRVLELLPDRLADATAALEVVADFWRVAAYSYKVDEIKARILEEIRDQVFQSQAKKWQARGFARKPFQAEQKTLWTLKKRVERI